MYFYTDDGKEVTARKLPMPERRDWVRAGVERIQQKTGYHWDIDAMLEKIARDQLWAFAIAVDGETLGGVIVDVIDEQFPERTVFHIWCVFGERIREWVRPGLEAMKAIARHVQADCVRMSSPRKGWLEILPRGKVSWVMEVEI